MSKPWAKYEIDFLDHSKFLALTANAICLWLEAKNYCDKYHTDGMFPREALKTFRFNGSKAVDLLMRSCGQKPSGEAYAPLWEFLDLGGGTYRMHDYLVHNDCREVVLERIEDADDKTELRRLRNRQKQAEYRQRRRAELDQLRTSNVTHNVTTNVTPVTSTPTETTTPTEREKKSALALPTDGDDRIAGFVERYPRIYAKCRSNALYRVAEARDFPAFVDIVGREPDDSRLDSMLELFLTVKGRDWLNTPGTPRQFLNLMPECDRLLREHGR